MTSPDFTPETRIAEIERSAMRCLSPKPCPIREDDEVCEACTLQQTPLTWADVEDFTAELRNDADVLDGIADANGGDDSDLRSADVRRKVAAQLADLVRARDLCAVYEKALREIGDYSRHPASIAQTALPREKWGEIAQKVVVG